MAYMFRIDVDVVTVGMFMYRRRQAFLTAMKRTSVHTYELSVSYNKDGSALFRESRRHHRNNEYDAPTRLSQGYGFIQCRVI